MWKAETTKAVSEMGQRYEPLAMLRRMLPVLVRMVQAQVGQPIAPGEAWKNYRQSLAKKYLYHITTLTKMADLGRIEDDDGDYGFVDHASINVMARAVIENFIVFEWVFGPDDESLSHFRFLTWRAAGLKDRVDLPVMGHEALAIQANEMLQFNECCEQIKTNPHFEGLSNGAKDRLMKGNWRMGQSIGEIAIKVGFHSKNIDAIYSHLCGYSHSNFISAMQVGQAGIEAETMLSKMPLGVACNMTARLITTYGRIFPLAQKVLTDASADDQQTVRLWNLKSEDFEKHYGPEVS